MKKILIIEDDMQVNEIYKQKLTEEGYEVIITTSAQDGWNAVKNDNPDLVLLDIMLPGGMNGFDFLEQLRHDKIMQNIPVYVLTNLDSERKVAMDIGATDYFVKANTSIDEIVKRINNLLKQELS